MTSAEDSTRVDQYFEMWIAHVVESEEFEVTIEPADRYGWQIHVDGKNVLPTSETEGLPWENFTLHRDWFDDLSEEQREYVLSINEELIEDGV